MVYRNVKLMRAGKLQPLSDRTSFTLGKNQAITSSSTASLFVPQNPALGDEQSAITIVEFGDFECPFTLQEFPIIRSLMARYPQVRFIYRDFPISELHKNALPAALAARCAQAQKKYWEYHDKLFLNQADLSTAALQRYALEAGLDTAAFNNCLSNETYKKEVARDLQDGAALGVRGTPTFFINGSKVEGVVSAAAWQEIFKYFGI